VTPVPFLTEATIIAKAIGDVANLLATTEGQLQMKEWREDRAKFKADVEAAASWFKTLGWFKGIGK
jgi:hypothetical protein